MATAYYPNAKILFSKEEYEKRYERAWELMDNQNLDALFINNEENITYFSGSKAYTPWNFYHRPTFFILPKNKEPTLIVNTGFQDAASIASPIDDIRFFDEAYPPIDLLTSIFKELKLDDKTIGAELGYEQRFGMPAGDYLKITKKLPNAKFKDGADVIWKLRMIKSPAEVDHIRKACDITTYAFETSFKKMEPGMTEEDLNRVCMNLMMEKGADKPGLVLIHTTAPPIKDVGTQQGRKFKPGSIIYLDGGAIYKTYWADFARMAKVGDITPEQKKLQQGIVNITHGMMDKVKPGMKASDMVKITLEEYKKEGIPRTEETGQVGHGIGLLCSEQPRLTSYNDTILQPGMTLAIEPVLMTEHGCFSNEENIVVTEDGYELLSKAKTHFHEIT
ncbi:MAG: M24 family metallopeptidase [Candidatus Ranarchaeia archaeon]|jgi:Xaa-Pro aminopeptidase